MLMQPLRFFPTFVVLALSTVLICLGADAARAATNDPSPDFVDTPQPDAAPNQDINALRNSVDIAPAPPAPFIKPERLEYFHKYRRGLSAMGAGVLDTKRLQNDEPVLVRTALRYLFFDNKLRAYEAGADLDSDGTGAIQLSRRFIFSQTKFRLYERLGLAVRIDPDDQLGTFLRYRHYQIRGATGFERLISDPISFRTELEASLSMHSLQFGLYFGLAWAW